MAVGRITKVVIFDRHIYRPTGLVGRWMTKVTTRFEAEAKRAAPRRSGQLAAGIEAGVQQVGPKQVEGTISSTAKHTLWVIRGTGYPVKGREGRIYSRRGFARARRGLGPEKRFFDIKPRDWGTKRGKPLPGTLLAVGKQSLYPPIRRVASVAGQDPNNFFEVAWRRTARNHRAIRGYSLPDL